jgi:hypothetical protein
MKQNDWKKILHENKLNEKTSRVLLKPKELGEGVPVTVHIDDEGYLILKDKQGKMIFLHPSQVVQLYKFITKIKY